MFLIKIIQWGEIHKKREFDDPLRKKKNNQENSKNNIPTGNSSNCKLKKLEDYCFAYSVSLYSFYFYRLKAKQNIIKKMDNFLR